jgi:hypothetical protein
MAAASPNTLSNFVMPLFQVGAQAGLGILLGRILDSLIEPALADAEGELLDKSEVSEFVEIVLQMGAGAILMHQSLGLLLPKDGAGNPVVNSGDGVLAFFFYWSQHSMLFKLKRLIKLQEKKLGIKHKHESFNNSKPDKETA